MVIPVMCMCEWWLYEGRGEVGGGGERVVRGRRGEGGQVGLGEVRGVGGGRGLRWGGWVLCRGVEGGCRRRVGRGACMFFF